MVDFLTSIGEKTNCFSSFEDVCTGIDVSNY